MKKIILLHFIFLQVMFSAQTHRFYYELKMNKNGEIIPINMILDIDVEKKMTKFYDEEFLEIDSINKADGKKLQAQFLSNQRLTRKTNSFENSQYYTQMYDY